MGQFKSPGCKARNKLNDSLFPSGSIGDDRLLKRRQLLDLRALKRIAPDSSENSATLLPPHHIMFPL